MSSGTLIVCSISIGNDLDITTRVFQALSTVKYIACEDTRVIKDLLNRLGISHDDYQLFRMDQYQEKRSFDTFNQYINEFDVLFLSDAGTPGISDPGPLLINHCLENQINVQIYPGVSAITAFIAGSGKLMNDFYFGGFMPRKTNDIKHKVLECIERSTVGIWFESPKRIFKTIELIGTHYPDLDIICAKELTKPYEQYFRGKSVDVYQKLQKSDLRGEWIFLVDGSSVSIDDTDKLKQYSIQFETIGLTGKQVKAVAEMFGLPKNKLYQEFKAL